jgi:lysophospholipase L1-like esterase
VSQRAGELALGVIVAGTVTVLTLAVAEVGIRLLAPVADPYAMYKVQTPAVNRFIRSEFPPRYRLRTSTEAGLPGMGGGTKWFTTNNMGFRGDSLALPKPADELRVFLIGGSTMECLYLDDTESIDRVVQTRLEGSLDDAVRPRIYNAGKSGDASDDHIAMLVHRILHLEPDVVVVFAGANDLTRSIVRADPHHFVPLDSSATPWVAADQVRFLATELQLGRRLYYALRPLLPRSDRRVAEEISSHSDYRDKVRIRERAPVTEARPRLDLATCRTNLLTLAGATAANRVRLVFMTQQSTWNGADSLVRRWHWIRHRDGITYRDELMHDALEAMNDVMREVARERQVPLYDLSRTLPKSSEFFYDDLHFNVQGARVAGVGLASFLVSDQAAALWKAPLARVPRGGSRNHGRVAER